MKSLHLSLTLASVVLSYNLLNLPPVLAQENPRLELSLKEPLLSNAPPELEEITNVDQLTDVSPRHWAYEALRDLVERYRCIDDFGQKKFNGDRAISRYEFAAGLNLCLFKIKRLLSGLENKIVSQKDLAAMQRLEEEFATELKATAGRIDQLEQRIDTLSEHQFSPTTILRGLVDFNFASALGTKKAVAPGINTREDLNSTPTLSTRAIINFDTSFTGRDRLRTNLIAANNSGFGSTVTGTEMSLLIGMQNTANKVVLGTLFYEFPLGDRGILSIAPTSDFPTRIFPALNPVNSISNFGAESPIYDFAFGSGAILYYHLTDQIAAGVSYLAATGTSPNQGVFNGQYTLLSQLSYTVSEQLALAFTYGRYYAPQPEQTINLTGSKGSQFAQVPFGGNTPTSSNAFGLQFTYKLADSLILGGWGSYVNGIAEGSPKVSNINGSQGSRADIWSWAITASLTDLIKAGSQLSFVFGMPPKATANDIVARQDRDTSLHLELSYSYPLTERIYIAPGFLVITNPEHNAANPPVWVGLLRTSFFF
jgi:hypothetical protein